MVIWENNMRKINNKELKDVSFGLIVGIGFGYIIAFITFSFYLESVLDSGFSVNDTFAQSLMKCYDKSDVCYSEICYLDLEENLIGGCSMSKVDCGLIKKRYGGIK